MNVRGDFLWSLSRVYTPEKIDMKIFVNVARLEIGQLFTRGMRRGRPCTLDTFLVISVSYFVW